jgi:hypothetical protein
MEAAQSVAREDDAVALALANDMRKALRFSSGLRSFWRATVDMSDPVSVVRARVAQRNAAFLEFVRASVLAHPGSPYLPLLAAARIDADRLTALVGEHGVEGALRRLYEAGVYATLDEFKGNGSIQRAGVQLDVAAADFDNPATTSHLAGASGGTRSGGTPLLIDLNDLLDELPPRLLHMQAHQQLGRRFVVWMPAPPSYASLRIALLNSKAGLPMARWFSQTRPGLNLTSGKSAYLTWSTILMSRLSGQHVPLPRYVPIDQAEVVARFLAERTACGERLQVCTMVSTAVRLAKKAQALGLDISGHTLRTTSEPLTDAKAALFRAAGLEVMSVYAMLEAGILGFSCAAPEAPDDMHLALHRMAVLPVQRAYPGLEGMIEALHVSAFSPQNPKVMINVESGDYGVLTERRCGCLLQEAGLHQHLHTIRSYEKLSSAGMTFLGHDLIDVIEVSLPMRFGGGPTDYQFVESEIAGETVVRLLVRPEIGPLDDARVIDFVLDELRRRSPAGRMQTTIWRDSNMLRVERAQPYLTGSAKIQALHVQKPEL